MMSAQAVSDRQKRAITSLASRLRGRLICVTVLALALSASATGASPPPCATNGAGDPALSAVDKARAVPGEYVPGTLVRLALFDVPVIDTRDVRVDYVTAVAYERLIAAAQREGHRLVAVSGYRSFEEQRYTFYKWMLFEMERAVETGEPIDEAAAQARANRYSALPGHSEHQLGTALDLSTFELALELSGELALTDAGRWLAANAHEYGFVTSYPPGKEALTGFKAEPWHIRFVGSRIAAELHELNYLDPTNTVVVNDYLASLPSASCAAVPRTWRLREFTE